MVVLTRRSAACFVFALASCIAGCVLTGEGTGRFAFSHAAHVGDQGLECVNCHADAGRAEEPGMPSPDTCSVCHDEIDATKPVAQHVSTLFDGENFRARHALSLGNEVKFSHARHVGMISDCASCHADHAESTGDASSAFTMDTCTRCHARRDVASACSTCHRELDVTVPPASHRVDWKRSHGRCARSGSDATADRCSLCHQESACVQCHREEQPENHTAYWLQRGHGITARMDRGSCAACHREDTCASCHAETEPRNHTANFGAPRATHCVSCHTPLAKEGCAACHRDTHSHALAAPKPSDPVHFSGQNCRQCHGLSAPLPHVDNGDDCNACHH